MRKKRIYYKGKRVSKGENEIIIFLNETKILFEKEKSFEQCLSLKGNKLRFDFWLPDYNTLIEFDGLHHYKPVNKYRRAQKTHKNTKINDEIKNLFCKENNINLIRISYKDIEYISLLIPYYLFNY
ncbi:hypothetical protein K9L16_04295 [Candidatus Pacearchaeota archaeon]|nr:hypothetical protein [Candidatus Pacearchaeota archaeon]